MEDIGYALDFKEIKRVGCQWIDDLMDHGMILNPKDEKVINTVRDLGTKLWLMSLNGKGEYCNPSVENIAREVILAEQILFEQYPMLDVGSVKIFETPNCWTELQYIDVPQRERDNFYEEHYDQIKAYAGRKGILEYDDRKSDVVAL
jgi:6-pyruvoyltetrahydropterin/6-carboxytetrahydropterin synthase